MPIPRSQARRLCAGSEFDLVDASYRDRVAVFTPAQLKAKLKRARRLADREIVSEGGEHARRRQLFGEAADRYERRLRRLEGGPAPAPAHRPVRKQQLAETRRLDRAKTRQAEASQSLLSVKRLQQVQSRVAAILGYLKGRNFAIQGKRDARTNRR